jgi:hypothetical protein
VHIDRKAHFANCANPYDELGRSNFSRRGLDNAGPEKRLDALIRGYETDLMPADEVMDRVIESEHVCIVISIYIMSLIILCILCQLIMGKLRLIRIHHDHNDQNEKSLFGSTTKPCAQDAQWHLSTVPIYSASSHQGQSCQPWLSLSIHSRQQYTFEVHYLNHRNHHHHEDDPSTWN